MKVRDLLLICCLAVLSGTAYLVSSQVRYRLGFPLDDAWIHQTYARNFAQGNGWSFKAGFPSGGTTAPLWTFLLSIGYWVGLDRLFWAYFLGIGLLAIVGILSLRTFQLSDRSLGWLGCFFVLEWHFVWASVSGMETILAIVLVVAVYERLLADKSMWSLSALLAASVWVRPDLLSLALPIGVSLVIRANSNRQPWHYQLQPLFLVAFSGLAYGFFNLSVSGAWLPTTYYAKQIEYMELRSLPLSYRLWQQFSVSLVGASSLFLLGFFYRAYLFFKTKAWQGLAWIGWYFLMIGLYATRLPVIYQHGRYMMPAMVVYFLIGLDGSIRLYRWASQKPIVGWVVTRAGVVSWMILTIVFWALGANAFAKDVQLIETQMVETAHWAQKNLPAQSRIAVHDIGAMGYFTNHDLVDLAGLINPEVIPFLRDEAKLAEYLDQKQVDYLICFPQWYPNLTKDLAVLHSADRIITEAYGELPMTIYRWRVNGLRKLWNR
jgi:hypothetical protein